MQIEPQEPDIVHLNLILAIKYISDERLYIRGEGESEYKLIEGREYSW